MNRESAKMIGRNEDAMRVAASSARISTQPGTALEIYERSGDREKDLKLIGKVLSSGHKSVVEHQTFNIAFDNVSVMAEQFVIEFRLASFTVKSRRYVDFSDAGYIIPQDMSDAVLRLYKDSADALFALYQKLLDAGIPKEDARFVLPYGFRSNFFCSMNVRELMLMITAMLRGRGSRFPELVLLGTQLKEQFDEIYPGILDKEMQRASDEAAEEDPDAIRNGDALPPQIALVGEPASPVELLDTAMRFNGRFDGFSRENMRRLMCDARPRELELLNYSFRIDNVSLACVTHFTRHRMLSLQLRRELYALSCGNYVLPQTIAENGEMCALYKEAFAKQAEAARQARALGATDEQLVYFAMAGHTTSILISMNARELLHFFKLRSCSRAQWEIRAIARDMIALLKGTKAREVFENFGPTCAVTGKCPEGAMCCGHPVVIENGEWKIQ